MSLPRTRIVGIGTAVPTPSYTQAELFSLFGFQDRITRKVFKTPHIGKRHLLLPEVDPIAGTLQPETQSQLNEKFRKGSFEIGREAILTAMKDANIKPKDIGGIVCITTTGWMVPGLSCLFLRELGFRSDCYRTDIVGMGCNAGLNGLATLDGWARTNEGKVGLMLCCEVNSAIYCRDDTPRDGIVNSLFGDGAAAIIVTANNDKSTGKEPTILDFEHEMIAEQWDSMRFDWHEELQRWRFFISKEIPFLLGEYVQRPIRRLFETHGLQQKDIRHWLLHTGGGAVIDTIKSRLELSENDVRHTRSVLREYGNLSSGSFLFSYKRLKEEAVARSGDYGVMITMGPGAQIETALLRW